VGIAFIVAAAIVGKIATGPLFFAKDYAMFRSLLALVVLLGIVAAVAPVQAQQAQTRSKVVLQVSEADPAKWNVALNNARNIQADLGAANVDIELVAYGPGIGMLKAESVVGNRVDEALAAGVKVLACENTMRNQKLAKDDMLPKVGYVASGVVEIMQKQQQGWAYIRP
jgi:intracellular sulfur oxidation DsrE/DsrF family protein